jgi:DNA-binding transcriptional MocR family regulator
VRGTEHTDLRVNFPILGEQAALLSRSLTRLASDQITLGLALAPMAAVASGQARHVALDVLARVGCFASERTVVLAGSAKQALIGVLAALVPTGAAIGMEPLTYPAAKAIATALGIRAVPLEMDHDGVIPESIDRAFAEAPLRALYLQPTVHNPLGTVMSRSRRKVVAETIRRLGIMLIEDVVNAFLEPDAPPSIGEDVPELAVLIHSLSKSHGPGVSVGMVVVGAPALVKPVTAAIEGRALLPSGLVLQALTQLAADGTLAKLEAAKRDDARVRQGLLRHCLSAHKIVAHPNGYYAWLELPASWGTEAFALAARDRGVVLERGESFATHRGACNGVRISLSAPALAELGEALRSLNQLLVSGPPRDAA